MLSPRLKATFAFGLGFLLLGGLVAYVGPARLAAALLAASPVHLALAAFCYLSFFVLRGARWRTLLSQGAPDVRLASTTGVTAVGWLANSLLPFKSGDVLRAALLAKREGISAGHSAASVALERILDLVGLALLAAFGLLLIPTESVPSWFARAVEIAWLLPVVGIAALVLLVWMRGPALRLSAALLGRFGNLGAKLHGFVETTVDGVAALARRPRLLAILAPQTVLVALAQVLIFTFLVQAFIPGTPFALAFGGSAVFLLSFVVSVTPGNVGTYEAAFGAVFVALGVPLEVAVPAAVLTHLTTTLIVTLAGCGALFALGATPGRPVLAKVSPGGGTE